MSLIAEEILDLDIYWAMLCIVLAGKQVVGYGSVVGVVDSWAHL